MEPMDRVPVADTPRQPGEASIPPAPMRPLLLPLVLAALCGPAHAQRPDTMDTPRILIVVTSHDQLGDTGRPTGYYLPEVSHPHRVFEAAGFEVEFASPLGGAAPADPGSRTLDDPINRAFLAGPAAAGLDRTLRLADVDPARYDAVFFAGGHGTMWDFPDAEGLDRVAREVYEEGGIVAAVCHGPAALVNVRLSDGSFLVARKQVSAFTDEEERSVGLDGVVPFLLASRLSERGALHSGAANFQAYVVRDERLVTGQNPASATGTAEAVVEAVREAKLATSE